MEENNSKTDIKTKENKKPDIKIFVSHRIDMEAETIDNPLYVNVRCGAVFDKRENVEMLGDNTGDNISEKRESFNELTVMYWAWKNVEADYYGLCHYRRHFSFAEKKSSERTNEQILLYKEEYLNKHTVEKYGINSYAWRHIVAFVGDGNVEQLFTNRLTIYQNAINEILSSPIIGHGPAYFESKYGSGYYAHNIILEAAVESGIIVTAIVVIVLMYYYIKIIKSHDKMALTLLILFFSLCMPKLMLSNQVYKDYSFWMMIGVIMMFLNRRRTNENTVHC